MAVVIESRIDEAVEQMLEEGADSRQIRRETGLNWQQIRQIRRKFENRVTGNDGPHHRCGGCGHLVLMPCRICATRARARR